HGFFAIAAAQREKRQALVRELGFALPAHGFAVAARRLGEILLALGHEPEQEPGVHQLGVELDGALEPFARAARRAFETLDETEIEKARAVRRVERQAALHLRARQAPLPFDEESEPALELLAQASAQWPLAHEEPRPALRAVAVLVGIGALAARTDHRASA